MDFAYTRDYPQKVAVQIGYVPSLLRPEPPDVADIDFDDGKLLVAIDRSPWVFDVDLAGTQAPPFYEVSCIGDAGTVTGIGNSSPVSISGATPDATYTCTATETNTAGTSDLSQPSKPYLAEEDPVGIPVWLLHEASKTRD